MGHIGDPILVLVNWDQEQIDNLGRFLETHFVKHVLKFGRVGG